MTRASTAIIERNGGTAVTTMSRVPDGVWRYAELVGRLHELLSRTRNEDRLPALLTVIHPHLAAERAPLTTAPPVIDLGLLRQLSRLLGAAQSPDLLLVVLDEVTPHLSQPLPGIELPNLPPEVALTNREVQVLAGMARGRTNAAIGSELGLSADTVKTHARRMFDKLEAHDRAHAVARGYQLGILGGAA